MGIEAAIHALQAGQLVIHPTETVISLTGDPYNAASVTAARHLKGYDDERPFLCLVANDEAARALAAEWPDAAQRLAQRFWPGDLTLVVEAAPTAPVAVTSEGRIAVRPVADPVSRSLIEAWQGPLFSTSANPREVTASQSITEAIEGLAASPKFGVVGVALEPEASGGPTRPRRASTVVDVTCVPPLIVRAGAIPIEKLDEVCPGISALQP